MSLVRTTSAYRIQVEADWQGTNVTIPVCGESKPLTHLTLLMEVIGIMIGKGRPVPRSEIDDYQTLFNLQECFSHKNKVQL